MSAQSLNPILALIQQNTALNIIIYTIIKIMYNINCGNAYAML